MYDANQSERSGDFDYDMTGGSSVSGFTIGTRELPPCRQEPTATHPTPGDFELDPEESDVNLIAALKSERARLRELVPGSTVIVEKSFRCYGADTHDSDRVQWEVSVGIGETVGMCYADAGSMSLRDACDAALADFRAKTLDAVATSAERAVA